MAPTNVRRPRWDFVMKAPTAKLTLRCSIYTRVSTDARLEQEFNSLDAQREASEAYIKSQAHEGSSLVRTRYDDGGFSGGSMERPALQRLLLEVQAKRIDVVVVYKVDRLTRSLADFAKLVELFDAHGVSFVSVTQSFNTTTSLGRLTLNVLLSFAQFEREVTGERIRDKIAASKKKGIWMGGVVPLGYRVEARALHIIEGHAELVRGLFKRYLEVGSVARLKELLDAEDVRLPVRIDGKGRSTGGGLFSRGHIYKIFSNPIYIGQIAHKGDVHEGQHPAIVGREHWDKAQQSLKDHLTTKTQRRDRQSTNALLIGKLFDDRGNLMTPSWSMRGSKRWSYYVSQAILRGDKASSGRSGLRLPAISLGLWHNFGDDCSFETARDICRYPFDLGITHFDLANNYGPPPGSAEEAFGRLLASDFAAHRDELIISSKAGYLMWPRPYGEWGGRPQAPPCKLGSKPQAAGRRICRHLLLASPRASRESCQVLR
jgi:site-specific DNA recombinase